MGVREEGWRSGDAVFQFLPGTTPPVLTLTDFDFRLVKKGRALALPVSVTLYGFAPNHGKAAS